MITKNLRKVLFLLTCCILSLTIFNSCDSLEPGTMPTEMIYILNGNFEDRAAFSNYPDRWNPYIPAGRSEYLTYKQDENEFHSGQHSGLLSISENHPQEQKSYFYLQEVQALLPQYSYTLTGWIKMNTYNEVATLILVIYDEESVFINSIPALPAEPAVNENGWILYTMQFSLPENAAFANLYTYVQVPQNIGNSVWFDDITIVKQTE